MIALSKYRFSVMVVSILIYLGSFYPLYAVISRSAIVLSLIPILLIGVLYGWKGGMAAALFSIPFNIIMFIISGEPDTSAFVGQNFLATQIVFLVFGISIGYISDLKNRAETELKRRIASEEEREKLISELQSALSEVRQLREIIPICSACKKIRNDEGFWQQVEHYIHEHTGSEFTHGICPDCLKRLYNF